jgi:hypothetical protein
VALAVRATNEVEQDIEKPVENEQHLHLLPEVNLLVPNQLCLIVGLTSDPDEDKER